MLTKGSENTLQNRVIIRNLLQIIVDTYIMLRFFGSSVYVKYTCILTQNKQDRTNTFYSLWKIQNDGNLAFYCILFFMNVRNKQNCNSRRF